MPFDIFRISKNYRKCLFSSLGFDGMVNMKATAVSRVMKKIFQRTGHPTLKAHCHRSSFLRWGGRCGASAQQLLLTTHHSAKSGSWIQYFGNGQSAFEEIDMDALEKLQLIFPYPSSGMRFDLPLDQRHDWLPWVTRGAAASSASATPSSRPPRTPERANAPQDAFLPVVGESTEKNDERRRQGKRKAAAVE